MVHSALFSAIWCNGPDLIWAAQVQAVQTGNILVCDCLFGNTLLIKNVTFETFGVEVGSVQKQGHIHTTLRIDIKYQIIV